MVKNGKRKKKAWCGQYWMSQTNQQLIAPGQCITQANKASSIRTQPKAREIRAQILWQHSYTLTHQCSIFKSQWDEDTCFHVDMLRMSGFTPVLTPR